MADMNEPSILRSDNYLSGSRATNITIRPLRLAYLVADDDPQVAVRAIESCCLTWGGYWNPIIPWSATEGLTDDWRRMLDILDPDNLVDCVGIPEADSEVFQQRGQFVHRWENPLTSFFTVGTLQYSALNAFGEYLKSSKTNYVVPNPTLADENDPLYLPLISRFGRLNESFIEERLRYHQLLSGVNYSRFAEVRDVDLSGKTEDVLLGMLPSIARPGTWSGPADTPLLINLTLIGTKTSGPTYSIGGPDEELVEYHRGFVNCVVITGEAGSVNDLAWYWNLRMERSSNWPFPCWIPLELLDSDLGKTIVDRALGLADQRGREGLADDPGLYILSSSVGQSELERRLVPRFPYATIVTENLHWFLSGTAKLHLLAEQREVHFNRGTGRALIPQPDALQRFGFDRVVYEIGIDGAQIPSSNTLHQKHLVTPRRVTRSGALEEFAYATSWPTLKNIYIPDGWTILSSVFNDHGYECSPSDKGRIAVGLLELLGSIDDVGVVASSDVHSTLKDLCRVRGEGSDGPTRAYFADRRTAQHSEFVAAWGREEANTILRWLLKKRILFRGTMLECPGCRLNLWYESNRISDLWRCDGCQSTVPIPLELGNTAWAYRVNELYARGHDQGVITHLLTLFNLPAQSFSLPGTSVLGYYPGVLLKARDDNAVPKDAVEIDVAGIINGRLVIAECKDSGDKLTRTEVDAMIDMANHLECSRLLFVTPTEFSPDLFATANDRCTAQVDWWEGSGLFNTSVHERLTGSRDEQSEEERRRQYLGQLARGLERSE